MVAKPTISARRPNRTAEAPPSPPVQISPAALPDVDPDDTAAIAFTMRGRMAATPQPEGGEGDRPLPSTTSKIEPIQTVEPAIPGRLFVEASLPESSASETPLISVKLPTDIGRQLAAVADRRGSKRTMVAIEALTEPLRQLASEHRAGRFPELPRVVSGTIRSGIAFALPPDLAADLEFVLRERRAVRAQIVTRLLAPAINELYAAEIGRTRR